MNSNFRRLKESRNVWIITKFIPPVTEAFNHFLATPVPTPPPFHRYARRMKPVEYTIKDMFERDYGSVRP